MNASGFQRRLCGRNRLNAQMRIDPTTTTGLWTRDAAADDDESTLLCP